MNQTAGPHAANRAADFEPRDRFVAFAFAAADLLIEAEPSGRIVFAAGAFRSRFGEPPEAFVDRPVSELVAPEDRTLLDMALGLLAARGRLAPLALRLNDPARSAFTLAGMATLHLGNRKRLCLTFGPLPAALADPGPISAEAFVREAEHRLVAGGTKHSLRLLELPADASAALAACPDATAEIEDAVSSGGDGARMASTLGPGRYGLLGATSDRNDLGALAARLEAVLRSHGLEGGVTAREVLLSSDGLTTMQAVRALRHALGTFARDGDGALSRRGLGGGLAGCVARLSSHAGLLRQAVAGRHFDLSFQPIVDLRDRVPHHYEALIRPHAIRAADIASPQDFVLLAETLGLTEELDLAVAGRVLDALAISDAPLACNLSGLSVQSPPFRDALLSLLASRPATSRRLMVEVTESAEIEDEAEAQRTLDGLREMGVALCIDDFGAGAAAFRYLRAFKVDYVKVDGMYVRNAVRAERDRTFVSAMVDLSLAVGARVIAEQIETEADAEVMRALGVHLGQGYLYGRPGPFPARTAARRRGLQNEVWA